MQILIKGGNIVDAIGEKQFKGDILIDKGIIIKIAKSLTEYYNSATVQIIDATDMLVTSGFVDMHCHLREPGNEAAEDIESGCRAAAAGGWTSVACMPNTNPPIDNKDIVEKIKERARKVGVVNVYPIGAVTKVQKGEDLNDIEELRKAGVIAVSDDGRPIMNANVMRNALTSAKLSNLPIIAHSEDLNLANGGSMNEGVVSALMGVRGIHRSAEETMIARDIVLAETLNTPLHVAHISTKGSVELIRSAKARGVKVTCETCPHYFVLSEDAVKDYNTNAKMNPPLRTNDDINSIIEGINDGTIDAIATDHAPHTAEAKARAFETAPFGIIGFETAFPLAWTYLVDRKGINSYKVIRAFTCNPARILGLKSKIGEGETADITIIDTNAKQVVDVNKFMSKSKNSPFDGFKLDCTIKYTIVGGKIIYSNGEIK